MLMQQLLGPSELRSRRHRDELRLRRHHLCDGLVHVLQEAQIAVGENADGLAVADHRETRDPVLRHQPERLANALLRMEGDRIHDHTGLEALHQRHFARLAGRRQVPVDDTEPAVLGHADRGGVFRHGVHRCRHERKVQRDLAGQARAHVDVTGQDRRRPGRQQHVVEGQRFAKARRSFVRIVARVGHLVIDHRMRAAPRPKSRLPSAASAE